MLSSSGSGVSHWIRPTEWKGSKHPWLSRHRKSFSQLWSQNSCLVYLGFPCPQKAEINSAIQESPHMILPCISAVAIRRSVLRILCSPVWNCRHGPQKLSKLPGQFFTASTARLFLSSWSFLITKLRPGYYIKKSNANQLLPQSLVQLVPFDVPAAATPAARPRGPAALLHRRSPSSKHQRATDALSIGRGNLKGLVLSHR